jgi:hypothetical protein
MYNLVHTHLKHIIFIGSQPLLQLVSLGYEHEKYPYQVKFLSYL